VDRIPRSYPNIYCACQSIENERSINSSKASTEEIQRTINAEKFLRHNLSQDELTAESEMQRAGRYLQAYLEGLQLGAHLPDTEIQPADDLIILFGQTLVNVWKITSDETYLYRATVTLEFALTKSLQCYQIRLLLVRIYRLLG
jgi:N-terminal acetyltransferase B complex non-catalytic subunit